jgi:hypothetical protein
MTQAAAFTGTILVAHMYTPKTIPHIARSSRPMMLPAYAGLFVEMQWGGGKNTTMAANAASSQNQIARICGLLVLSLY